MNGVEKGRKKELTLMEEVDGDKFREKQNEWRRVVEAREGERR